MGVFPLKPVHEQLPLEECEAEVSASRRRARRAEPLAELMEKLTDHIEGSEVAHHVHESSFLVWRNGTEEVGALGRVLCSLVGTPWMSRSAQQSQETLLARC